MIVFVAIQATTVGAAEPLRGPLVIRLATDECEFLPRGKMRSMKDVMVGVEPSQVVVAQRHVVGAQKFQTTLVFGVSPDASSGELCNYVEYRTQERNAERVFRAQVARRLSQVSAESLAAFHNPKDEGQQKAFARLMRAAIGDYAGKHGLTIMTAKFNRYAK